jgi:phage terminase small subunit
MNNENLGRDDKPRTKLTEQNKLFIDYLLADPQENQTQAALKAGYSKKKPKNAGAMAAGMMKRPQIAEYYQSRKAERKERLDIDQDFVVNELIELLQMAKGVKPIIHSKVNDDGKIEKVLTYKSNLTAANKTVEMIGRHLGVFNDKQDITFTSSLEKTIADISKENTENRKSLLPKDNIDMDNLDDE